MLVRGYAYLALCKNAVHVLFLPSGVPRPTKGAGTLRRAVRSQTFAGILGGRHMECAYYFARILGGRHMECAYYFDQSNQALRDDLRENRKFPGKVQFRLRI